MESHSPRICYYCGIPLPGSVLEIQGTCSACKVGAIPFDVARSYGPYAGKLRKLIWKFKFEGHRHLADPLGVLLDRALSNIEQQDHPTWIVPVPAHPSRKKKRGFDQTALLGRALSRRLEIPVFTGLCRVKTTRPQPGLNRHQRQENLRGAFGLYEGARLADRDVLIVDDVWTTGITIAEVCRLLRHETSVDTIVVVTLARVSRRHP